MMNPHGLGMMVSQPNSPSVFKGDQPFDFPALPSMPPRLAKIGRQLSQMSDNFLGPDPAFPEGPSVKPSPSPYQNRVVLPETIPGMGDEPVLCPYCDKPLPPSLFAEVAAHRHDREKGVGPARSRSLSTRPGQSPDGERGLKSPLSGSLPDSGALLDVTPVQTPVLPSPKPGSSSDFDATVRSGEQADSVAQKATVAPEQLQRWARLAGVTVDIPKTSAKSREPDKQVPLLPPPPPPDRQSSTASTSRFNFFRKTSSRQEGEDDSEDDDDERATGGYARLDAPGSPDEEERKITLHDEPRRISEVSDATVSETVTPEEKLSDEELRSVLKEVVQTLSDISKSQAELHNSHSSLLTSLKIARSNLAMAEANTEMLEEQVKRHSAIASGRNASDTSFKPVAATPPLTRPAIATPQTAGNTPSIQPQPQASIPNTAPPSSAPSRSSLDAPRAPQTPAQVDAQRRPHSIQIPGNTPQSSNAAAGSNESKGMFGFWREGKRKGGLGLNIPSAAQVMAAFPDLTPTSERSHYDFGRSPPSPAVPFSAALPDSSLRSPELRRNNTVAGRAVGDSGMVRSSSYANLSSGAASMVEPPATTAELYKVRQALTIASSKIETMNKELIELKKGKVEMEAELENLSQALFEEANKMVSEERRKRGELEEALKEVKEEREALKETIKVLGGQVEEASSTIDEQEKAEQLDEVPELQDFAPRDLDKHYAALRKSIHHVAEGTDVQPVSPITVPTVDASADAPPTAIEPPVAVRRHSLPDIKTPEPVAPELHDPWAERTANPSVAAATYSESYVGPARGIEITPIETHVTTPDPIPNEQNKDVSGEGELVPPTGVGGDAEGGADQKLDDLMEKLQTDMGSEDSERRSN